MANRGRPDDERRGIEPSRQRRDRGGWDDQEAGSREPRSWSDEGDRRAFGDHSGEGGYGPGGFHRQSPQGGYGPEGYGPEPGRERQGQAQRMDGGQVRARSGSYAQEDFSPGAERSRIREDQRYGDHRSVGETWGRGQAQGEAEHGGVDRRRQGGDQGYADASADDHEPHYRQWRERQLADYDNDYRRWRDAQAKRHDEDYRRWRSERHTRFAREFDDWRARQSDRQLSSGSIGETAEARAAAGASGLAQATEPVQEVTGGQGREEPDKD